MIQNQNGRIPYRLTASPVALRDAGFEPIDYLRIAAALRLASAFLLPAAA